MASIRLKFRPSATPGCEGALFYQVVHRRVVRMVHTGCSVQPGEWDGRAAAVRIVGPPRRQAQLRMVASKLRWGARLLARIVGEKEAAGLEYSTDDVVACFLGCPPCPTLFGFARSQAERKEAMGRLGTAKTYRDAMSSLARFRGGEDMAIADLDADTLKAYEAWLRGRGLKRNSSSCYLRTLRTLYRRAVACGLAPAADVFGGVFTGFAKTPKRAVAIAGIKAVGRLALPQGSPLAFARDVFMLSLYLQGMSFVDMAYLRKADIRGGLLQYCRKKTGQCIAVAWEKPMQAIVDRYASKAAGPYLLPIITAADGTERRQYERAEHNVNRNLKKVGLMAGIGFPLTTYVARHTWASAMRDMGCGLSLISAGLGHESLRTTQVYLSAIDVASVAKANRRLMARIMK